MTRVALLAAGAFVLTSAMAASAQGIVIGGRGIGIGIGIGPGLRSAPEYHPRVRSYSEEPARPRRQHRQHDEDEKAESPASAKSETNENSSIAALSPGPDTPDLHSSIAVLTTKSDEPGSHPESSSIATSAAPAEPAQATAVVVQASEPSVQNAAAPNLVLCSRYLPTAGRTVQVPCE